MKSLFVNHKAQMLIEIVVAIGIIGLVLVGVSDLMTRSIKVASFQNQRDEALGIVKNMLADYRVARDLDPEGFYLSVTNTLIDPCETDKPYKCLVTVEKDATDTSVLISITAEWQDGGRAYNVKLSQSLYRTIK